MDAQFVRSVYSANFVHNEDISSPEIIEKCLSEAGADISLIMKEAVSQETKKILREQTEVAYEKGIFGAPTFCVGNELFWGNDRLERALKWADDTNG